MANHMILLLSLFITYIYTINGRKITSSSNLGLVPPQPSQVCSLLYRSKEISKIICYH